MKKLSVLLLLLFVIASMIKCVSYSTGNIDVLNTPHELSKKDKKINYRVNVKAYSCQYNPNSAIAQYEVDYRKGRWGTYSPLSRESDDNWNKNDMRTQFLASKKIVKSEFDNYLKNNNLGLKQVFDKNEDDLFLDISVIWHDITDDVDIMTSGWCIGGSLTLFPAMLKNYVVYYSIDVYEKKQVDLLLNKMKSRITKNDISYDDKGNIVDKKQVIDYDTLSLEGLQPIGKFEYKRGFVQRWFTPPIAIFASSIFSADKAFTKSTQNIINEFNYDLTSGFNSISKDDLERDGYGIILNDDQIGDNKNAEALAILGGIQSGMNVATAGLSKGGSMKHNISDIAKHEAYTFGKEIAMQFAKSEIQKRFTDEDKNMFILMYEQSGQYYFGGASNILNKLNIKSAKGKKIKIGKMYFNQKKDLDKWINKKKTEAELKEKNEAALNKSRIREQEENI